jgi:hypothetical protein
MARIPAASRTRGALAEKAFKAWLDRTRLGYMIVDQTPFTVPITASKVKRPDFLVGILDHMVAVDVKGRDLFDGHGIIEIDEFEGFHFFQRYFGLTVWYAWYPDREHDVALLFRNTDIRAAHRMRLKGREVCAIPVDAMTQCRPFDEGFDYALFVASCEG